MAPDTPGELGARHLLSIIEVGYIFGILYKATSPDRDWRIWLYVLNLLIIGTDLFLYFLYRDRRPAD